MGMVVRSNIMAVNANRQLGMNSSAVTKSLEKLSSGFKINRAGDDASGLAISEKMKAQIKGLETASANSQDGISLIQTAEGALTEVHSMLNRMTELATKSANGTIQDEVDRENIQQEVNALISEIDRIGDSTNFNGINLIDGSLSGGGSTTATTVKISVATTKVAAVAGEYESDAVAAAALKQGDSYSMTIGLDNGKSYTINLKVVGDDTDATGERGLLVDENGKSYGTVAASHAAGAGATAAELQNALLAAAKDSGLAKDFNVSLDGGKLVFENKVGGTNAPKVASIGAQSVISGTTAVVAQKITGTTAAADEKRDLDGDNIIAYDGTNADDAVFTINGKKFALAATGQDVTGLGKDVTVLIGTQIDTADNRSIIEKQTGLTVETGGTNNGILLSAGVSSNGGAGLTLQIGDTAADFNKVTVSVEDMRSNGLGVAGLDVSSQDTAKGAIETIKEAINKVSTNRGNLGALQNRLEYTINNLDVTAENMTAANSRIRDTDMAKQMMDYTKMNVLNQAAQAMLAQANQQPQSILQLLQ